jgi:hypothetical protein
LEAAGQRQEAAELQAIIAELNGGDRGGRAMRGAEAEDQPEVEQHRERDEAEALHQRQRIVETKGDEEDPDRLAGDGEPA